MEQTYDLEQYAGRVVKDLGLENLGAEERDKVLEMLRQRLNQVIVVTVLKLMSPSQKARLGQALENPGTRDSAIAEVAAEIPHLAEILQEALAEEYEVIRRAME